MRNERREVWREADRLFLQWLDLDVDARAHWQAAQCPDDAVRRALDRLIAAHATPGPALPALSPGAVSSVVAALAAAADDQPEERNRLAGRRLGDWELMEEIGRGGMSVVYRARLVGADYRQQAAVKLLGMALAGSGGGARFAQERRVLASLQHPHIARLIGGGIAEDGTPYLVMHLVDGVAIDEWCHAQALDLQARLQLMVLVCDAVAYAHRNLVVHRDLKPANILVCDGGVPVLLDFGIAKLLESDDDHTRTGLRALTPGFAAPEQLAGGTITTATDVFGLGAVLVRLCADCAPLPRDLDNILAMAQRDEPERRYPDARALAADLRRFLALEPVHASPDSAWYRLRVLARRRRALVASLALAAVLLASGSAATLWQAQRATAQAARAEATRDFLVDLLAAGDIESSGGADPRVSDLIAAGADRIGASFIGEPRLRAELSMLLGSLEIMHGDLDRAGPLLAAALAHAERDPDDSRMLATVLYHLGTLANRRAQPAQAIEHFERALRSQGAGAGEDEALRARVLVGLAYAMDNSGRGAEMQQRIESDLERPGAFVDPAARTDALTALSMLERDPRRKLALMRRIEDLQPALAPSPVKQMTLHSQLAAAHVHAGSTLDAVRHAREATVLADRIYPPVHVSRARLHANLGVILNTAGFRTDALASLATAEGIYRQLGDDASPAFAALLNNRGVLLRDSGLAADAVPLLEETVELARALFGATDRRTASALRNLIAARVELGDHPRLDDELAECMAIAEANTSTRERGACLASGAQVALAQAQPATALARLAESEALYAQDDALTPVFRARAALTRGRAHQAMHDLAAASGAFREGLAAVTQDPLPLRVLGWQLHAAVGALAARAGRHDEAADHAGKALAILQALGLGDGEAARSLHARAGASP